MSDTQLPRYQVFLQEKPGQPHQDVGSVHAPDSELALLNARDVFVRRPECFSLWVVPANSIFSATRQEFETGFENMSAAPPSDSATETYYVSCKSKSSGTQTLLGEVQAASPAQALDQAMHKYSFPSPPFVWWVFPARQVLSSDQNEIESMFSPAMDKSFRQSTDFHTLTQMRRIEIQRARDVANNSVIASDQTDSG